MWNLSLASVSALTWQFWTLTFDSHPLVRRPVKCESHGSVVKGTWEDCSYKKMLQWDHEHQTLHKPQWPHSSLIKFLILHSLLSCFHTLQSWSLLDFTWWNCVQEWKCPHKSDPTLHGLLPAISLVQSLCNVWLSPSDNKAGNCLENSEWKWVSCVLPPARYDQALPFT